MNEKLNGKMKKTVNVEQIQLMMKAEKVSSQSLFFVRVPCGLKIFLILICLTLINV